jgi:CheY-like chemotaxis protein
MSDLLTGEKATLLVADDDDGHAELIQIVLRQAGVDNPIHRCRDGQEVLDFLLMVGPGPHRQRNHRYLLLLDIRMPKIDGEGVLERIRSHATLRKLPVIMLTTTDDPKSIEKCYRLGCSGFITKPLEINRFFETLKRLGLYIGVLQIPLLEDS